MSASALNSPAVLPTPDVPGKAAEWPSLTRSGHLRASDWLQIAIGEGWEEGTDCALSWLEYDGDHHRSWLSEFLHNQSLPTGLAQTPRRAVSDGAAPQVLSEEKTSIQTRIRYGKYSMNALGVSLPQSPGDL